MTGHGLRIARALVVCAQTVAAILLALSPALPGGTTGAAELKPRLILLADIGGDPDDQQSMIRLMENRK